jgi:N-methylhydantoinase B/oxoprolinase/acetone carboxylase alpha subunit
VEKVREDVMNGFVSTKKARDVYGVAIKNSDMENPETVEVDYEATEELRKQKKAQE